MTYMDLQAMRHYVRQAQKIIYETRSCIIIGCDKCECAYKGAIDGLFVHSIYYVKPRAVLWKDVVKTV